MKSGRVFLLFLLLVISPLTSCQRGEIPPLSRENLFVLSIGRLEDQVDLFGIEQRGQMGKIRIAMQDGIVWIVDGNGGKVQRFTSYGDLISMVYNPETNPPPLTLKTEFDEGDVVTRKAFAWPLEAPGELSIDSQKELFVEERLPENRRQQDPSTLQQLDRVVLHFDRDGQFVDFLGQEGPGGTPFPYMEGLHHSVDDELVVVCRTIKGYTVYWFDRHGNPLFVVLLDREDVPVPDDSSLPPSLEAVYPAPDERVLYLKVNYYKQIIDETTDSVFGIDLSEAKLWAMKVEDGTYVDSMTIPDYEFRESTGGAGDDAVHRGIYDLLGVANDGQVFMYAPQAGGYVLLILEKGSHARRHGFIHVRDDELYYSTFRLSPEGIISALLAAEYEVRLVWWRASGLFGESLP